MISIFQKTRKQINNNYLDIQLVLIYIYKYNVDNRVIELGVEEEDKWTYMNACAN